MQEDEKTADKKSNKPKGDEETPSTIKTEPTIIDTPPEPDEVAVVEAVDAPIIEEPTPVNTPIEPLSEDDVVADNEFVSEEQGRENPKFKSTFTLGSDVKIVHYRPVDNGDS